MPDEPIGFDQVIAPLTLERFLSDYWNKTLLHLKGRKGRFTALLPWDELSTILEWHAPSPQLKLFQDGKQVEARRYIDGQPSLMQLNAGGLIASLAQGATLILDRVERFAPHVSQLALEMEDLLEATLNVNVYAGWRKQKGFDLHWDGQDLIVLQLCGRKRWQVHSPTRLYPLEDDIEAPAKPSGPPVWEGILEDGDMLYVPRGWWHVAFPLDEASLHLTFSAVPPNAADFLRWWTARMLRHPEMRKNLPRQGDAKARRDLLDTYVKLAQASIERDPVAEFLRERNAGRRARPRVRLSLAPTEQQAPIGMTTRVRLATSHGLFIEFDTADGVPRFLAGGGYYNFDPQFTPVFERLSDRESVSVQDLCAGFRDRDMIIKLVGALEILANAGIILKESVHS